MNLTPADYRALLDRARNEERLTLVEWEALGSLLAATAVRDQQLEDAREAMRDIEAGLISGDCYKHMPDAYFKRLRAFLAAGLDVQEAGQ